MSNQHPIRQPLDTLGHSEVRAVRSSRKHAVRHSPVGYGPSADQRTSS
jgi:hypothetical protein